MYFIYFTLIINKHFDFCCFRALAYTTLDRLCAVFLYNFNNPRIMYQTGKGINHSVPVLVPEDTISALTTLVDLALREQCGVNKDNSYSTVSSKYNVSGRIEPRKITATKM